MSGHEYRVVPAPRRGVKAKGAKTAEERFALAVAEVMNAMAAEGWDYVRSDILPCEERQGLTGRTVVHHALMVFRRSLPGAAGERVPTVAAVSAPAPVLPAPAALPGFLAAGPRAVVPPVTTAPALGPAQRRAED
jgi:hypothetical protein